MSRFLLEPCTDGRCAYFYVHCNECSVSLLSCDKLPNNDTHSLVGHKSFLKSDKLPTAACVRNCNLGICRVPLRGCDIAVCIYINLGVCVCVCELGFQLAAGRYSMG